MDVDASPESLEDPRFHRDGDRYALWAWMRRHAPVHRHEPGATGGFWSLTRYDDVRHVYAHPDVFSSSHGVLLRRCEDGADPGGGLTMALTDPPRHTALRGLLAPHFDPRSARDLLDGIRSDVHRALAPALDGEVVDAAQDVGAQLSLTIICRILGVPAADFELLRRWTHRAFHHGHALTSSAELTRYFVQLMFDRMGDGGRDATAALLDGEVDGDLLTETEVLLNIENLVGASENAGLSIAAGLLAFVEHEDQWHALRRDPGLMPRAVEEVLRWSTSATHSMRTVRRPTTLHGRELAAGDAVVLWLPSANRDPAAFDAPESFDVSRSPNRHVALGHGVHVCIGGTVARAQLRVLLTELLRSGRRLELVEPVARLASIAVNGPASMKCQLVR